MIAGKDWLAKFLKTDRRRSERRAARGLVAYYWYGSTPTPHTITDVSRTGVYVRTEQRWHPGTVLTMTVQKADAPETDPERAIAVQARVIRAGQDGVGFQFVGQMSFASLESGRLPDLKGIHRFLDSAGYEPAELSLH